MKLTKKDRIRNAVCAAVSILAFLTIWQLATMFSHLGELIPSPIEVVQYLFTVDKIGRRTFLQHSLVSLSRVLIAYSAACVPPRRASPTPCWPLCAACRASAR